MNPEYQNDFVRRVAAFMDDEQRRAPAGFSVVGAVLGMVVEIHVADGVSREEFLESVNDMWGRIVHHPSVGVPTDSWTRTVQRFNRLVLAASPEQVREAEKAFQEAVERRRGSDQ